MATDLARTDKSLKGYLMQPAAIKAIEAVLPRHMNAERLLKVALVAISRSHKLLECTQESILRSLMNAAELGLDVTGTLGQGYLVPYWNKNIGKHEAQFIPGYRGLILLSRNSGTISSIRARLVCERDEFKVYYGTHENILHEPIIGDDRGPIIAVYAVAELKGGGEQFEVMTKEEVDGIRKRSKASESGPWGTDYGEMARKTVVRRLCKYLPLSPDDKLGKAVDLENQAEAELPALPLTLPRGVREVGTLSVEELKPAADQQVRKPEEVPDPAGMAPIGGDTKVAVETVEAAAGPGRTGHFPIAADLPHQKQEEYDFNLGARTIAELVKQAAGLAGCDGRTITKAERVVAEGILRDATGSFSHVHEMPMDASLYEVTIEKLEARVNAAPEPQNGPVDDPKVELFDGSLR